MREELKITQNLSVLDGVYLGSFTNGATLSVLAGGEILYKGRLIETDQEIYAALQLFLAEAGHYPADERFPDDLDWANEEIEHLKGCLSQAVNIICILHEKARENGFNKQADEKGSDDSGCRGGCTDCHCSK